MQFLKGAGRFYMLLMRCFSMYYDNSHALIYASWCQHLPDNAKIYLNVNNVLRRVKKIITTSRGLRAMTVLPEGVRRMPIYALDLLVISYLVLDGLEADSVIRSSRLTSIPLNSQQPTGYSELTIGCH
jgi:hypothetical protein